jgi:translation initiation factor 3 subunit D
VADFTNSGAGDNYFGRRADKMNKGRREFRQRQEDEENAEDTFQLVDTTKTGTTTKRFVNPASKRRQQSMRLRQINSRRQQAAGGSAGGQLDKVTRPTGGRGGPGGRGGRGGFTGRGGRGTWQNRPDRQPSVAVQNTWNGVEEIDLAKLSKNLTAPTTVPAPTDILWCGFLDEYNENYDKVTSRAPVPLKRMENKEFYPVTTTDDPVLERLAIDGAGQVFVTDTSTYCAESLWLFLYLPGPHSLILFVLQSWLIS